MVIKKTKPKSETSTTEENKEVENVNTDEHPPKDEEKEKDEETATEEGNDPNNEKEEENKEEVKTESYKDAVSKISAKYEKRIADINEQHAKEIKERDDVIAEMVASEGGNESKPTTTIKDEIAKRRAYNKW